MAHQKRGFHVPKHVPNMSLKGFTHSLSTRKAVGAVLSAEFKYLLEELRQQEHLPDDAAVQSFLRQKYNENTHSFSLMKTVKQLTKVSESVCLILVEGSARGTGFLLFDRFILTNGHVVGHEHELDQVTWRLNTTVTAMFGFEGPGTGEELQVKPNVVAFHHGMDERQKLLDFALLELSDDAELPTCCPLRISYSPPSTCEGICIVGHPDGEAKAMDPCIIFYKDCEKAHQSENFLHIMFKMGLDNKEETNINQSNKQITYNSWFSHGSSGSPVFNELCEVIGIHSGGYAYEDDRRETMRVMDYALPMLPILAHIYKQAKERGRLDIVNYIQSQKNMEAVIHTAEPAGEEQHGLEEAEGASPNEIKCLPDGFALKMRQPYRSPTSKLFESLHSDSHSLLRKGIEQKILKDHSEVHALFREEFDKIVDSFSEVNKVKTLMRLSNSVCRLDCENEAKGTGFLLFENFILTNSHVIGETKPGTKKLRSSLRAIFNYEIVHRKGVTVAVKDEVIVRVQGTVKGKHMDLALLELSEKVKYDPILSCSNQYSFGKHVSGGTCIIGHPNGGIKKLDFCSIIPENARDKAVEAHLKENINNIYMVMRNYDVENLLYRNSCITYNTCLLHGSSGSPVFNEDCKLIGIHTGGFDYKEEGGKTRSIIEYALPMDDTLNCIKDHLLKSKNDDIYSKLESCYYHYY